MVKIERTKTPPPSLALEAAKANGSYSGDDVWAQLQEDFGEKCYLCEYDGATSVEIEHLIPHKGDKALKFDWENLFFSCAHCNSMKNRREYDGKILNCCEKDPEKYLIQKLENGHICVELYAEYQADETAVMTAQLLTQCFENKNTGARVHECQVIVNELTKTMNVLYRALDKYKENPKGRSLKTLRAMLDRSYKFAGFSRTYVRMHIEEYPALAPYIALHDAT